MSLILGIIALVLAIVVAVTKRGDIMLVLLCVAVGCLAVLHIAAGVGPY